MVKIIEKIKNLFKPKELTLEDKVKYLLERDIDLYSNRYNIDTYMFIEPDIVYTIDKYRYINTFAIESQHIQLGVISNSIYKELKFFQWFTSEGKLILNKKETLEEFLIYGLKIVKIYEFRIKLIGVSNNSYSNAKKIKPYYTEYINIVDRLYEIENTK